MPFFSRCSIIVPVLNEGDVLVALVERLQILRASGHELIIADGGSTDSALSQIVSRVDRIVCSRPGRAIQMNQAAAVASGDVLWFMHADSSFHDILALLDEVLSLGQKSACWGRFDIRLSGTDWRLRWVEKLMNWRSRLTGIATGDQAIFVERQTFKAVGGFPELPIMEDIEISRSLKKISSPLCVTRTLITSSRRWEREGIFRTIFLMWTLRLGWFLGISPQRLARYYRLCNSAMPVS